MENTYWYKGHGIDYWVKRTSLSETETIEFLRQGVDLEKFALQNEGLLSQD